MNASGSLTYQAAYEAFGKHGDTDSSQEWTDLNAPNLDRQQANTKDEDPTGLLNEGFRYRDLETGTFITRDPLGFVDGPNVYTYVVQNPWTKFDPLGLKEVIATEKDTENLPDASAKVNQYVNDIIVKAFEEARVNPENDVAELVYAYLTAGNKTGGNDIGLVQTMHKQDPKLFTKTKTEGTIFEGAFRTFVPMSPAWTDNKILAQAMNVNGETIGTDKLDHMFFDGYVLSGMSESEALKDSHEAEMGEMGRLTSGVYSHADIAANMAGWPFYKGVKESFEAGKEFKFDIRNYDLDKMNERKNLNEYTNKTLGIIYKNKERMAENEN